MADSKISALPASTTPLAGTEVLPIVQSSTTKQVTVADLTAGRAVSVASLTASAASVIEVTDNTNAALRITQLGTGNALLVEDSANPDATPFVVNASGQVSVGGTSLYTSGGVTASLQVTGITADTGAIAINSFRNSANGAFLSFAHSKSGVNGTQTALVQNDATGLIRFSGSDGTAFIQTAAIESFVDGTPGTNDMPGRLVFSTTAEGASTPTERMRLDSSGNLGIGTTSPGSKLAVTGTAGFTQTTGIATVRNSGTTILEYHVRPNAGNSGYITFTEDAVSDRWVIGTEGGNSAFLFKTGSAGSNTERMRLDSAGNLGLGVTPNAVWATNRKVLQVGGLAGAAVALTGTGGSGEIFYNSYFNTSSANIYNVSSYAGKTDFNIASAGGFTWQLAPSGTAGNAITFTQAMTLDASSNLLVGTTNASSTVGVGIKLTQQTDAPGLYIIGNSASNTKFPIIVYSSSSSSNKFYVDYSGTISAVTTTISAISDIRFKENIRDLDAGLNKIMALKPRLYDWKEGKGADIKNARGFIAQEFETVFPDLIDEWQDPAPEGEEPYKAVRADLIPVLVKAIQEQQALIESLTQRLAALESK